MSRHECVFSDDLFVPSKEILAKTFEDALSGNYQEVSCKVVECPDLRKYGLVKEGLGGFAEYAECGTVLGSMFTPSKQRDVYTLGETMKTFGRKNAFVVGSGAGSCDEWVINSEWTGNAYLENGTMKENGSRAAFVTDMNQLPEKFTVRKANMRGEFGTIGNLLHTDGTKGEVIEVRARVRRSDKNWSEDPHDQEFIRIMRTALAKKFPAASQQIVVGGVMLVVKGKVVTHIMPPHFPPPGSKPGKSWPDMKGWGERFFVSEKQIVGCTTFLNNQGKGLPNGAVWRPDHTHFFSRDGTEAGHYHHDVSPDIIEYVAYLVPASRIHKVELKGFSKL